jgi:PTH1 family peptidyl-tRNA hydrolase
VTLPLVVGLGNPGSEYRGSRHNVGFEVVDRLAARAKLLFRSARELDGYPGRRAFSWQRMTTPAAFLLKPETYMNLSGEVVAPVARFLAQGAEIDPARILVVYDDMDLPLGRLRIRPHGGAGGQNGMRSIIEHLGTDLFPRLRVGIGRPGTAAARHVLAPFRPEEREEAEISISEAADAIGEWLRDGDLEKCMTRFHSRWNQES